MKLTPHASACVDTYVDVIGAQERMQSIDPTARWIFSYGAVTISTHGFDSMNCPSIRIGTSAFTAAGWPGTFYPKNLKAADYLSFYAEHFDAVEVDSTFYGTPRTGTVRSWDAKTPKGFLFAAKVPQLCGDENYVATRAGGSVSGVF